MGVASLVLGILALVIAWVPCVGVYALVFSILGVILGLCGMSAAKKTGQGKGISIAGFVCNAIATAIAIWWFLGVGAAVSAGAEAIKEVSESETAKNLSEVGKNLDELSSSAKELSDTANAAASEASEAVKSAKSGLSSALKKFGQD